MRVACSLTTRSVPPSAPGADAEVAERIRHRVRRGLEDSGGLHPPTLFTPWPSTSITPRARRCGPPPLPRSPRPPAGVGNPSSVHGHGQAARAALEEARERLAAVLDCDPLEVVLTSGGTESVNLAITGAYRAARGRPDLLVPGGEHAATVEAVDALVASEGARLVPLAVDADARLEPAVLAAALDEHAHDRRARQPPLGEQRGGHREPRARARAPDPGVGRATARRRGRGVRGDPRVVPGVRRRRC